MSYTQEIAAATLVIAQEGTKNADRADYQCNGADDQTIINAALNSLTSGRTHKERVVLRGKFFISDEIIVPSYTVLDLRQAYVEATADAGYVIDVNYTPRTHVDVIGGYINANNFACHGIFLRGSYLNVIGPTYVRNTQGHYDGIFYSNVSNGFCTHVDIRDCWRNGLTIAHDSENLYFSDVFVSGTRGSSPKAGVFMEPSYQESQVGLMRNIQLNHIYTTDNGVGFNLNLNMIDAAAPDTSIFLSDYHSYQDDSGILIAGGSVKGVMQVNNVTCVENAYSAIRVCNNGYNTVKMYFNDLDLQDGNTSLGTDSIYSTGFVVYIGSTSPDRGDVGNVYVDGIKINNGFLYGIVLKSQSVYGRNIKNVSIKNIEINNIGYTKTIVPSLVDNNDIFLHYGKPYIQALSYSTPAVGDWFISEITNEGATATVCHTLKADKTAFPEITFRVVAPYVIRLSPASPSEIVPYGNGAGKYIQSGIVGSAVTLMKIDASKWYVTNMTGIWTAEA